MISLNEKSTEISVGDIISLSEYRKIRKEHRKLLIQTKIKRRLHVGPFVVLHFENYLTLWSQIQEMLHIEGGGKEQLSDELAAYNPLVPNGKELTATLMFEIDNPVSRATFLGKVGGIEEKVYMKVNGELIKAVPEEDVDRTSAEGKASSVQFIHFKFNDDQIKKFKSGSSHIEIGIDHNEYSHSTKLNDVTVKSLSADFI